jgi:hypothetical protein
MNIKGHFKMTRKEKIGCLVLLGILIGYGAYQAAYVTTEGSYQFGFSQGKAGYACSNYQSDCDNGLNNCSPGYNGVTNQTSCLDGFVNGWKQRCNSDLTTCAKYVLSDVFPGKLASNDPGVHMCLKTENNVADNDKHNLLSPLSKHCGHTYSETTMSTLNPMNLTLGGGITIIPNPNPHIFGPSSGPPIAPPTLELKGVN